MRSSARLLPLVFLALSCSVCVPLAQADSYTIRYLGAGGDHDETVAGDDFGDYTLRVNDISSAPCAALGGTTCYYTSASNPGVTSGYTLTPPALLVDPNPRAGAGCNAFTLAANATGTYLCSNGHEIFVGDVDGFGSTFYRGIWDGSDPVNDRVVGGADAYVVLTPNGSIYFDDESQDLFYEAVNLGPSPTPEPASLALVGSGALAAVACARRRLGQRSV